MDDDGDDEDEEDDEDDEGERWWWCLCSERLRSRLCPSCFVAVNSALSERTGGTAVLDSDPAASLMCSLAAAKNSTVKKGKKSEI